MAGDILAPLPSMPLLAADTEHFAVALLDHIRTQTPFDLITPMPNRQSYQKQWRQIPEEKFTRQWAGYATAVLPYSVHHSLAGPYYQFVQRQGERPEDWQFNAFLSTPTAIRSMRLRAIIPSVGTSRSSSTSSSP